MMVVSLALLSDHSVPYHTPQLRHNNYSCHHHHHDDGRGWGKNENEMRAFKTIDKYEIFNHQHQLVK
jgi:hypothetical protein